MKIQKLQIANFRNLEQVQIEPHPSLNLLVGANGAGKTSVIESIVVLSRGRSFRTTQASNLVGPESSTFQVFAETSADNKNSMKLGLERSGKRWRGRLNGQDLSQISQLTRLLPLVLVEPDSHFLVSGAPEVRRKYLDWGLFHVEQGFLNAWRSYSKALKQRNAALRQGNPRVLESLDALLAEHGTQLNNARTSFVGEISRHLQRLIGELSFNLSEISLEYQKGWSRPTYIESLEKQRDRDIERGQTSSGPHRADLVFHTGKAMARAVLSRGEQKMLAVALLLTQVEVFLENNKTPILLLDDLASEFDANHFNNALMRALKTGSQVWITGTGMVQPDLPHKLFHVEQGRVREVV